MKKFIILALLACVSMTCYCQDSAANPNVKYVVEKLEGLAQKLEQPTKHIYSVYVRQQPLEATVDIILILSLIIAGVLLIVVNWKKAEIDSTLNLQGVWVVFGFMLLIIFVIVLMCLGSGIVGKIFNPEYAAIQQILEKFK